jgi:hypothetical protein
VREFTDSGEGRARNILRGPRSAELKTYNPRNANQKRVQI